MKNETENHICQSCKNDFTIEPEDFAFYDRINVPPPTLCHICRQQRRYAWRNERTLYRRNCDLCQKSMVTIYSPNKPHKVYCNDCWWSDNWDPSSYGRDFDFTRPFFEQFRELQLEVPRMALLNKNSVNSDYTNHSGDNKDAYLSFATFGSENILYSTWVFYSRDIIDCSFITKKGERLFETIDSRGSFNCQYSMFLKGSSNCFYSFDLRGCNDCFMSYNLRNKSYVFRNEQLTREEYMRKMSEIDLSSYEVREELLNEYNTMLETKVVHKYARNERNINSIGSLLFDCKNTHQSFEVNEGENCKYLYGAIDPKDSYDLYHVGLNTELCYELQGCTRVVNCQFCTLCYDNLNVMYSDTCQNSQNLFGCISVKKGEYMIFNKKYSKEEYEVLKEKIIEHMSVESGSASGGKTTGEYGEFLPPSISPVCYNETQGNLYMPLSKEEVLAKGWLWEDETPGTYGKETIKSIDIPDNVKDIPDSFLKEIFACIECKRNYNIVPNELNFLRKENIPLPRKCPECRYKRRFELRPRRELWHRTCMCENLDDEHPSSGGNLCSNEFESSYPPDKPGKVYCESCYNSHIY